MVGILVDGKSEYYTLKTMLDPLPIKKVLYCDLQPYASSEQIAYVASKNINILLRENISKIILIIDKESRNDCTIDFARSIESALKNILKDSKLKINVNVVIKVNKYENWLISDPYAYKTLTGMFGTSVTSKIIKDIEPNKADNVDAIQLLNYLCKGVEFHKMKGAKAICKNFNPDRGGKNSRSLRRLLRLIGHPDYSEQSKHPIN